MGKPESHLASYVVIRFCCWCELEGGQFDRSKADSNQYEYAEYCMYDPLFTLLVCTTSARLAIPAVIDCFV